MSKNTRKTTKHPKHATAKIAAASITLTLGMASHSVWAQTDAAATTVLPTVVVEGQKTAAQIGFKAETTRVGKTKQALKDIPQAITVVTEQLIKDKNADTLKEALRNVAGITFNAGEGGRIGDNINLRGYSAVGDLYLDNIRDYAQYNRETFNAQQLDVLKGSASMLFGRGSTGGVINQVSKTALPVDANAVDLTYGSNDYKRATVDLNKSVTSNVAIRLNAMKTKSGTSFDGVKLDREAIAPTISIGAGTQDEVNLSYYYLKANDTPNYGVPYFNGQPIDTKRSQFYGLSDTDFEKSSASIATANYTHMFDNDSNIKTTVRDAHYTRDLRAVAPRLAAGATQATIDAGTAIMNRQRQSRGGQEHQVAVQSDYTKKFETGRFKHDMIAGVEYIDETSNRWTNTNAAANPTTTVANSNPNPTQSSALLNGWSRTAPNSYKAQSYALYAQDTVEIAPKWKVLGGLRYDHLKADYVRSTGGNLSMDIGAVSGRAGLMYLPNKDTTIYASYSSGFNSTAEAYQLDDRLANTDPEKTRNFEIGLKANLLNDKLSFRTSLSRSEKTNERNTDLASPDVYLLSGKRHTDALEFEIAGRITPKWDIFFNHAFMRSNIDNAAGTATNTLNMVPRNTPRYTTSLWTTYKIKPNFKIGAGIELVGKRYANDTNTNWVKGYTRVDALAEYDITKTFGIKFNVKNVFNKKFFEGVYAGHAVLGAPRTLEATLTMKF